MSKKVKQVACGSYHSVALTLDGEVRENVTLLDAEVAII